MRVVYVYMSFVCVWNTRVFALSIMPLACCSLDGPLLRSACLINTLVCINILCTHSHTRTLVFMRNDFFIDLFLSILFLLLPRCFFRNGTNWRCCSPAPKSANYTGIFAQCCKCFIFIFFYCAATRTLNNWRARLIFIRLAEKVIRPWCQLLSWRFFSPLHPDTLC